MASRVRFDWDGEGLIQRVQRAVAEAVDDTLDAVDSDASADHWWKPRSGYLERKIVTEKAIIDGDHVVGRVGATYSGQKGVRSAFYGLFLELRFPWLRPAGDRQFPTLAARIREKLR